MAVSIADQFEILLTISRRTVYVLPILDYYITELPARLLENGGRYQAQYLIPMNLPRLTPDTVDVIFDTYKTDLRCEIRSYVLKPKSKGWATLTTAKPSNLKDTLNVTNEELYPSIQHRFVVTLHHACQHGYDGETILCFPSP